MKIARLDHRGERFYVTIVRFYVPRAYRMPRLNSSTRHRKYSSTSLLLCRIRITAVIAIMLRAFHDDA